MIKCREITLVLAAAFFPMLCSAQDPPEVQIKPYGSYVPTSVDTIDLETGNVYLNIPLVSFPQLGKLPPLSFGISLNNAPYTQVQVCDPDLDPCTVYYDTLRYGISSTQPNNELRMAVDGSTMGIGAFLTSSQAGLLVAGKLGILRGGAPAELDYTLVDPTGGTHDLVSDIANYATTSTFRAIDGTGYTFVADGPGDATDPYDPENNGLGIYGLTATHPYWLSAGYLAGIRTGTVYDSSGVSYTNAFVAEPGLQPWDASSLPPKALQTTISDPSGNRITHSQWGMTRFTGFYSPNPQDYITKYFSSPAYQSAYSDSVGRTIQDPIELESMILFRSQLAGSTPPPSAACPNLGVSSEPAVMSFDWLVPGANQGTSTFTFCYTRLSGQITFETLPGDPGSGCTGYTPGFAYCYGPTWHPGYPPTEVRSINVGGYALQSVVLNDRSSYWGFVYDPSTGDLQKVVHPTGGSVSYAYQNVLFPSAECGLYCHSLLSRTEDDGAGHTSTKTYAYNTAPWVSNFTAPSYTTTESQYLADLHGQRPSPSFPHNDTVHNFSTIASYNTTYGDGSPNIYWAPQFKETRTDFFQGAASASSPLRTATTVYEYQWEVPPAMWTPGAGVVRSAINIVPNLITTTGPAGIESIVQRKYIDDTDGGLFIGGRVMCLQGTGGNADSCSPTNAFMPDNTFVYGDTATVSSLHPTYESISDGTRTLRTTTTWFQFEQSAPYYFANILDPPSVVTTIAPDGNAAGLTAFGYDIVNGTPSGTVKGDVTSVTKGFPNQFGAVGPWAPTTYTQYANSVPQMITDPKGTKTFVSSSQCNGLFPATVIAAYQSADTTPESTTTTRDCNTGSVLNIVDPNGTTTQMSYGDPLGRPTDIGLAIGTVSESHTGITYPSLTLAQTSRDQVTVHDGVIQERSTYDGFGRPTRQTNAAGFTVTTTYTPTGQVASVSNPQLASTSSVTDGTVSSSYDIFGRPVKQSEQDGSVRWWCYDGVQDLQNPQPNCAMRANRNGGVSWVDATDESGVHHQQTSDALGQLIASMEPNPSTGALALETNYGYDALGNLTSIKQWGNGAGETPQTRTFKYDAVSRLLWSQNPETGVICYGHGDGTIAGCQADGYDGNGNLLYKTDGAGRTVSYTYDALNRLTLQTAADIYNVYRYDTEASGSGAVTSNGIGHLVSMSNYNGGDQHFAYDPVGRLIHQSGCFLSHCTTTGSPVKATYDLSGNMTELTYPSGRHILQTWNAAGQLGHPQQPAVADIDSGQQFVQAITYNPDSSPNTTILGNAVQQVVSKNNRLQVQSTVTSDSLRPSTGLPFLSHTYSYINPLSPQSGNNGNIWGITDTLNGSRSQSFTYDALNRISSFSNGDAQNAVLNQQFQIDSFGNMSQSLGVNYFSCFDPATNRLNNASCNRNAAVTSPGPLPPALIYDNAGNLTGDTDGNGSPRTYAYDAESRLTSVAVSGNPPFTTYTYGADGSRAQKLNADGTFTEYLEFNGLPITEKDQTGTWTDYIYANGQKIAIVPGEDRQFHINTGGNGRFDLPVPQNPGGGAYTVQPEDTLCWRQLSPNVYGGVAVWFNNGQDSIGRGWMTSDGHLMHYMPPGSSSINRCVDLTGGGSDVGAQIIVLALLGYDASGAASPWDAYYADMAIFSQNGHVTPIINSQQPATSILTWNFGGPYYPLVSQLQSVPTAGGNPLAATHFFLSDHLGTAQMEFTSGGWPVWQGQFAPYGGELLDDAPLAPSAPDGSSSHYKFTGKERDQESGLDYFGARYYSSSMGRFSSPDPQGNSYADFSNPQSWNLYSYVLNNPLKYTDPTGEYCYYGDSDSTSDGFDQSQYDFHSSSAECTKTDENGNKGQWIEDAYTHGGFDDSGRPEEAISELTNTSTKPQPTVLVALDELVSSTVPGIIDNKINDALFRLMGNGPLSQLFKPSPSILFGTKNCGPGGDGSTNGATNGACQIHDACYAAAPGGGISADNNTSPLSPMNTAQAGQAKQCNQALYNAMRNHPDAPGSKAVQWWLVNGGSLPGGRYILYPGTEAKPW